MTIGKSYHLRTIGGIQINLHFSWFIIFGLLAYALSTSMFPQQYPGYNSWIYMFLGVTAALLLFCSVLVHELSHSLVAKSEGIEVHSVTLFFFGGVANISDELITPEKELKMALAGPLASFVIAAVSYCIYLFLPFVLVQGVLKYVFTVNLVLGVFNMVPGYPLDGGRVLRAIIWHKTNDLRKATWYAAYGGRLFGYILMIIGIVSVVLGIGGVWYILLGLFLVFLAKVGYEQAVVKQILSQVAVKDIMTRKYHLISSDKNIADFVDYCKEHKIHSVLLNTKKPKVMTINHVSRVPRQMWEKIKLGELASDVPVVSENDTAYHAFVQMQEHNLGFLPVQAKGKLAGGIGNSAILNLLRIHMLEDQAKTLEKIVIHKVKSRLPNKQNKKSVMKGKTSRQKKA